MFIIYFYVYKKNMRESGKKMTCKIIRERAWNGPDSPEKKKREKGEEKTKRENQEKKWSEYENEKWIK
jgi:hypothetical protein